MYSCYLNSKEAVADAVLSGVKVIEVDVSLTSDTVPILSHRFEPDGEILFPQKPTFKQFMETPLPNKNTPMSLEDLITNYKNWNGHFLMDCQFGSERFVASWLEKNCTKEMNSRIIFQIHDIKFLKELNQKNLFGYLHYNASLKELESNLSVLISNGVHSVSVEDHEIKNADSLSKLNSAGIHAYIYTVNHKRRFNFLMQMGASGVFSDRLIQKDVL